MGTSIGRGVAVRVVSRCAAGPVIAPPGSRRAVRGNLSPVKARVELQLELPGKPA